MVNMAVVNANHNKYGVMVFICLVLRCLQFRYNKTKVMTVFVLANKF